MNDDTNVLIKLSIPPVVIVALVSIVVYYVRQPEAIEELYTISGIVFSAWFVIYSITIPQYLPDIRRLHIRSAERLIEIRRSDSDQNPALQRDLLMGSVESIRGVSVRIFRSIILNTILILFLVLEVLNILSAQAVSVVIVTILMLTAYLVVFIFNMGSELVIQTKKTKGFIERQYPDMQKQKSSEEMIIVDGEDTFMHFSEGDRVRVDIPDRDDPDFERFHGEHGVVTAVLEDDAGSETGDTRDSRLYRVELDTGETMDFRWRDLRPL